MLFAFVTLCVSLNAQETTSEPAGVDYVEKYKTAPQEERDRIDSLFQPLVDEWKKEQVRTIGGVPFGISREKAEEMLEKKFGRAENVPYSTILYYKKVKYAGHDFDSVIFSFQSDGVNSYLNACVFVIDVKSLSEAIEKEKYVVETMLSRYKLLGIKDKNGYPYHAGGISPRWDGRWYTFSTEPYEEGLHTDIVQNDKKSYYVRIYYGPYNYINEEF